MKPFQDTRDDYIPLDDFVLERAGINPYDCDSLVEVAIQKQFSGSKRAEAYLEEIEGIYYRDKQGTDSRVIASEDYGSFGHMIRKDFANEWKPAKKEPENLPEKTTAATPVIKIINKELLRSVTKPLGMMIQHLITHGSLNFPKKGNIDDRGMAAGFVDMIQDLQYEQGQSSDYISRPGLYRCFNEAINALDPDNTDQ